MVVKEKEKWKIYFYGHYVFSPFMKEQNVHIVLIKKEKDN